MERKLPVWETLSEAFSQVNENYNSFIKALWIPFVVLIVVHFAFYLMVSNPESMWMLVNDLITLIIFAWMLNVTCRLAITQQAGDKLWTNRETWSAVWLVALSFVITILSLIPAGILFFILSFVSPFLAYLVGGITFVLLHFYLFARFVLIFPALAMGDSSTFKEAWKMSEGNGWRLVLLFALVPFTYAIVAMILGVLMPERLLFLILTVIGVLFALVGVIAVSLAYKKLKA